MHVATRLGYISEARRDELDKDLNAAGAPLVGLIRSTRLMPLVIPILLAFAGATLFAIGQRWMH